MPLITCRSTLSTLVALAAAGLAAGCAAAPSAAPAPTASPTASPTAGSSTRSAPAVAVGVPSTSGSSSPAASSSCAHNAASASTSGPAPALAAVQFTDGSHGWVAGAGAILSTSDAGRTWSRQYSGTAALNQVDFIDNEHGWAVGVDTLLRTTNGGVTWTPLAEPCQGEFDSIHFVSPTLGYAVATTPPGGSLLRSSDGGATWTLVPSAPADPQSACFANAADGYLGTPGHIWRSTDGGQRWTLALTEPGAAGSQQTSDTPQIECAGRSALWALFLGRDAAMGHAPYLAYASKDGRQWQGLFEERYLEAALRPGLKLPGGPGSYPGPFSAIDSGAAVFVGYTPPAGYGAAPVMLASDSGSTPALTIEGNVAGINEPFAASFLSLAKGWVVGENLQTHAYAIESTANSGRTWTTQYTTG